MDKMTFRSPLAAVAVAIALTHVVQGQLGGYPDRFADLTKEADSIVIKPKRPLKPLERRILN